MGKITLLLLGLAFTFNVFAESVDAPAVSVGDRWEWQHTNTLVNEKDLTIIEDVIEINASEIKVRERVKGRANFGVGTFTSEWNPKDVGDAKYEPCLRLFKFPLAVGEKWTDSSDKRLLSNGKHGKFSIKGEVVSKEQITTPVGKFDTYKVKVILNAVGTDEDANTGHTEDTYWYSPDVKNYVKSEHIFMRDGLVRNKDIRELQEFSLR